jgi:hypothetical protein
VLIKMHLNKTYSTVRISKIWQVSYSEQPETRSYFIIMAFQISGNNTDRSKLRTQRDYEQTKIAIFWVVAPHRIV